MPSRHPARPSCPCPPPFVSNPNIRPGAPGSKTRAAILHTGVRADPQRVRGHPRKARPHERPHPPERPWLRCHGPALPRSHRALPVTPLAHLRERSSDQAGIPGAARGVSNRRPVLDAKGWMLSGGREPFTLLQRKANGSTARQCRGDHSAPYPMRSSRSHRNTRGPRSSAWRAFPPKAHPG